MKNIQLLGVGNALVDIEYRVVDAELEQFGLTKGSMTLTDPQRQTELLEAMAQRTTHRSSGGSAANSIIAFAQFGGVGGYSSVLGADALGEFYASEFKELGIVLEAPFTQEQPTGTCVVLITPDSERTLNTTLAANTLYTRKNVNPELIARSEWVYIEGYKLTDNDGYEAVMETLFHAKKAGTHVAISCSDGFIVDVFGGQLREVLRSADLVFSNEREATGLSGEETAEEAFKSMCSTYKHVIVTDGLNGSHVMFNGNSAKIPAYRVEAVDATGAGDMYAGAFLYAVLHKHSVEHAGRLASYAAGQVVAQYGARLKTNHLEIRDAVLASPLV